MFYRWAKVVENLEREVSNFGSKIDSTQTQAKSFKFSQNLHT
jgi:hypothetical protein